VGSAMEFSVSRFYQELKDQLSEIRDPRRRKGTRYPLRPLLMLLILGFLRGRKNVKDILETTREDAETLRFLGLKRTQEVFFGLTSLPKETSPDWVLELFRGHWSIENRIHHVLDCSMGEDACRVRAGTGSAILGAFRRMALGLMQTTKGKRSLPSTMRYLDANGRILKLCLGSP